MALAGPDPEVVQDSEEIIRGKIEGKIQCSIICYLTKNRMCPTNLNL